MYSGFLEEILQLYDLGYSIQEISEDKNIPIDSVIILLKVVWSKEIVINSEL